MQNRHQRHTLFNQPAANPASSNEVQNGGPTINYDIEAIKLDRVRHAWPSKEGEAAGRRHSISSEESLSDCEELGANHDNYHRESALQTSFRYIIIYLLVLLVMIICHNDK